MAVRGSLMATPLTTPLTSDNNGVLTARPPLPLKTPLDAGLSFLRYSVKNHFFTTFAT
jgi:hypothetical protein